MRIARTIALILATCVIATAHAPPAKADVDVSFGLFYSNLSPHGSWLVSAEFGRVWQPAVYAPGWNPYYDGHWVCSDVGWTWVSDYPWGGIPYHYGTWVPDPRLGWVWVPGYTWAPSWVVFRTGPEYIGWAPVPPSFSIGASLAFGDDPDRFVFVGARDFLAPRVRAHAVPIQATRTLIRNTTIVNRITVENDVVVNRGPDVRVVERATGKRIGVTPIERVRRVAPADRVTKADLRVRREKRALRVAEPVRSDQPLPGPERSSSREGRRRPSDAQAGPLKSETQRDRRRPDEKASLSQTQRTQQKAAARQQLQAQPKAEARPKAQAQQKAQAQKKADASQKAKSKKQGEKKKDKKEPQDTKDRKNG